TPPKVTVDPARKPLPVIDTVVPPSGGPLESATRTSRSPGELLAVVTVTGTPPPTFGGMLLNRIRSVCPAVAVVETSIPDAPGPQSVSVTPVPLHAEGTAVYGPQAVPV